MPQQWCINTVGPCGVQTYNQWRKEDQYMHVSTDTRHFKEKKKHDYKVVGVQGKPKETRGGQARLRPWQPPGDSVGPWVAQSTAKSPPWVFKPWTVGGEGAVPHLRPGTQHSQQLYILLYSTPTLSISMSYFKNKNNSYPYPATSFWPYPDPSLTPAKENPSVQTCETPATRQDVVERAIPMVDPRLTGASDPKNHG
jgi:hypothetical protein